MDLKIESVNRRHGRLAFSLGRESWRPLDVARGTRGTPACSGVIDVEADFVASHDKPIIIDDD